MPKFRSRVVEIEAFKVVKGSKEPVPSWAQEAFNSGVLQLATETGLPDHKAVFTVKTLEGTMVANDGDWIIKGTEGELYPCKPSVFERKYEAI